jgi:hypothetical protein
MRFAPQWPDMGVRWLIQGSSMAKITVTKIEAAQRQIDASIRMLFYEGDPIAVMTISWAGFQILRGLCDNRGGGPIDNINTILRPEMRAEFWRNASAPHNYLKHADRDADDILENVSDELCDITIFIGISMYIYLENPLTLEMNLFFTWFTSIHPELFDIPDTSPTLAAVKKLRDGLHELIQSDTRSEKLEFGRMSLAYFEKHGIGQLSSELEAALKDELAQNLEVKKPQ